MLLTAAHCVYNYDMKSYPALVEFYWQKKDNTSRAIVPVTHIYIPWQYESTADPEYDYAICVLPECVGDRRNTMDFNTHFSEHNTTTIGYPGVAPYSGNRMYYTNNVIDRMEEQGRQYWHVKNGLPGGSSGGPWVYNNQIIGVNSWNSPGLTDVFSPIFNEEFTALYNEAVKKAPTISIGKFKLKNDNGWFVCKINITYEGTLYQHPDDIPINTSKEVSMNGKLPDFAIVKFRAAIVTSTSLDAQEEFIFDPASTKEARYKITGTLFGASMTYQGLH